MLPDVTTTASQCHVSDDTRTCGISRFASKDEWLVAGKQCASCYCLTKILSWSKSEKYEIVGEHPGARALPARQGLAIQVLLKTNQSTV